MVAIPHFENVARKGLHPQYFATTPILLLKSGLPSTKFDTWHPEHTEAVLVQVTTNKTHSSNSSSSRSSSYSSKAREHGVGNRLRGLRARRHEHGVRSVLRGPTGTERAPAVGTAWLVEASASHAQCGKSRVRWQCVEEGPVGESLRILSERRIPTYGRKVSEDPGVIFSLHLPWTAVNALGGLKKKASGQAGGPPRQ